MRRTLSTALQRASIVGLLCLLTIGCRGCGPGPAGANCNPDNSDSCEEGLVCAADSEGDDICQIPLGAECDPEDEEEFCLGEAECFAGEGEDELDGRCLAPRGVTCGADDECAPGLVCAETTGEEAKCFEQLVIRGQVFDSTTEDAIGGAHVIALDEQSSAVSDVAISGSDGAYELAVPAQRDDNGKPVSAIFTLRSSAQDYQTFPGGIRTALPIEADTAEKEEEGPYVIQNPATDIALIILKDAERGRPRISGEVISSVREAGVLVVAEAGGEGFTAVSDLDGVFTIFNVPSASYTVSGYARGVQLVPASVEVGDEPVEGVELVDAEEGLAAVSGSINPVEGAPPTSVVLVVESTFDEAFTRGEVPSGLRAPEAGPPTITGAWTIEGVPAGNYVVLTAFENDDAVRDPDTAIAGTTIPHITVPALGEAGQDEVVERDERLPHQHGEVGRPFTAGGDGTRP